MTPAERTYEIHEVAELTGLSSARLRAWERRYEIVRPRRMPNGYRAYTGDQVALLRAYARLTSAGERIGDLAQEPTDAVLARAEHRELDGTPLAALVDAVKAFDRERLEAIVAQQVVLRGLRPFAQEIVQPLAFAVGDLWALGKIPIAAEHLASEVVLHTLKGGLRVSRGHGPLAVCACLAGERHEWGILGTLTVVQEYGWRIHYLGPDLPVDEIVEAAWRLHPAAIAMSSAVSDNCAALLPALAALPARLPPGTVPIIGGGGADAHRAALEHIGFRVGLAAFSSAPVLPPVLN
ncbi:MAG TPA: MerR family transcriptional regulator [Gemmatimonadales bacterium]|nr:MerR family transcriptional regulator [Gemmatimonadales bacterium]